MPASLRKRKTTEDSVERLQKKRKPLGKSSLDNLDTPTKPKSVKKETKKKAEPKNEKNDVLSLHLETIQKLKNQFRLSAHAEVSGREEQKKEILKFIKDCIKEKKPNSLYIAGAPGTGKTLLVENLLSSVKNAKVVKINAMSATSKNIHEMIYNEICEENDYDSDEESAPEEFKLEIEKVISSKSSKMILLLLDEIDNLATSDQDVLYRIFEWTSLTNSRLVLIGIANALDLTDRLLPRLKAKNIVPKLLSFPAYSSDEIYAIMIDRFKAVTNEYEDFVQKSALDLCSKKVASYGDSRKALEVVRIGLEKVESETKSLIRDQDKENDSESISTPVLPKVTVRTMIQVLDEAFGGGNPILLKIRQLTPHQKAVIVLMCIMVRDGLEMNGSSVYENYIEVCRKKSKIIKEVSRSEFQDMLSGCLSVGVIDRATNSNRSTPKSRTPKSSQLNSVTKTPRTPSTTRNINLSSSVKRTPTTSGSIMDRNCVLVLNASQQDIETGIKDLPHLMELFDIKLKPIF